MKNGNVSKTKSCTDMISVLPINVESDIALSGSLYF